VLNALSTSTLGSFGSLDLMNVGLRLVRSASLSLFTLVEMEMEIELGRSSLSGSRSQAKAHQTRLSITDERAQKFLLFVCVFPHHLVPSPSRPRALTISDGDASSTSSAHDLQRQRLPPGLYIEEQCPPQRFPGARLPREPYVPPPCRTARAASSGNRPVLSLTAKSPSTAHPSGKQARDHFARQVRPYLSVLGCATAICYVKV
jgi:hypothetical protein